MTATANKLLRADWRSGGQCEPCVEATDVQALTSAIAAGDADAFTRFFHEWFDVMYAEAFRVTRRDQSFCYDVVQDAMLRVIRSLRPMRTADDLRRWLCVVVQSCAYDRLRREARRRRHEQAAGAEPAEPARDRPDRDRLAWLEGQLRQIDDDSARLLLMRHRFGWTLRQIGEAIGCAPGAVDGRLRRLVRRLRRIAREETDA